MSSSEDGESQTSGAPGRPTNGKRRKTDRGEDGDAEVRSAIACLFCRSRKMKCDGKRPTCHNCAVHERECVLVKKQSRPRPNNATIDALRSEVATLRRQLTSSTTPPLVHSTSPQPNPNQKPNTQNDHNWTEIEVPALVEAGPSHYGQTSAIRTPAPLSVRQGNPSPTSSMTTIGVGMEASTGRSFLESPYIPKSTHGPTSSIFSAHPPSVTQTDTQSSTRAFPRLPLDQSPENFARVTDEQRRYELMAKAAEGRHREGIDWRKGRFDFDGWDGELVMHLLELHWNRQHHASLLTYRPAFMRDWASGGPYFSKLLLNAILFGVAKFSDRPEVFSDPNDPSTAGKHFLIRVKSLLGDALDRSRITTVQALLLLSSSLGALGEHASGWMYSGIALRMITDMGLNYDAVNQPGITSQDLEIRRRVVWGGFVLDKIHSLYQGRAVTLQERDLHVPAIFLDDYEELEPWQPFAFNSVGTQFREVPAHSVSTFKQLCLLSTIMGRIINEVYADRPASGRPEEQLTRINQDLVDWGRDLPEHLRFDAEDLTAPMPTPTLLSLHALYHTLIILLHRPFVETGHLHTQDPAIATSSWSACVKAASASTKILISYSRAFTLRRAPYLISYVCYVSATCHVRILAADHTGNDAAFRESRQALRVCLDALEENEKTNTGTAKAREIIRGLMGQLNVKLPFEEPTLELNTSAFDIPTFNAADLEMIIRSFDANQWGASAGSAPNLHSYNSGNSGYNPYMNLDGSLQGMQGQGVLPDALFGYMHMPSWNGGSVGF